MVGCPRPNRWLVEPDSTARFTQRALVRMKETAKALLSKNKNELSAARTLYVSLDRADNVIEGGPAFDLEFQGAPSFVVGRAEPLSVLFSLRFRKSIQEPALEKRQGQGTLKPIS